MKYYCTMLIVCARNLMLFCMVSGDILIFMPGQEDIEVTCELIAGRFTLYFYDNCLLLCLAVLDIFSLLCYVP